ncbi:hypothetical protein P7C70_g5759, partial [Phenoliferia sp. Uapishka_3]
MALPRALIVGRGRSYGLQVVSHLTPFLNPVGISVLWPFSTSTLALALRTLHPPARVLAMGGAYSAEEAAEAKTVFEEYRKEVEEKIDEYGEGEAGQKTAFVKVHGVTEGGPPAVAAFIKAEMEKEFK